MTICRLTNNRFGVYYVYNCPTGTGPNYFLPAEICMMRLTARLSSLTLILTLSFTALIFAADRTQPAITHDLIALKDRPVTAKPTSVSISPEADIERVIVKLIEGTRARMSGNTLISLAGKDLRSLNAVFGKSAGKLKPMAIKAPEQVEREKDILERRVGQRLADFNNYYSIPVSSSAEAVRLVNALNRLPEVEIAYPMPRPTIATDIAPPTPDYSFQQDYLRVAPGGVDADWAHTQPGGDGSSVMVIDIEGAWKLDHEDLDAAANGNFGGTMTNDLSWRNHGTAVLGEMIGSNSGYGVTGICYGATAGVVSIASIGETEAMLIAIDSMEAGDVMLIELHAPGPRYNFQTRTDQLGYVCMEYWQANFDVIQLAWAKGVIVCEAAGNGAENYDTPIYQNLFDTTARNSHAILCGAGTPPGAGVDRSRLGFSNYGARVNLQGYGINVVTAGYGGLFNGGGDERQYYTSGFSGTSSASPIVTGAVVSLQGIYKAQYPGSVLTSDQVRDIMTATGSPQQSNPSEHIGPRPNLQAAAAVLPPPADLVLTPLYIDTTVPLSTQLTVTIDLYNRSAGTAIDFAAATVDSFTKGMIGDWLQVVNPAGTITPLSNYSLQVMLDASVIDDQSAPYKGMVRIAYGASGGSLDDTALLPVFVHVPCFDTTYSAKGSWEAGGPTHNWVDITTIGAKIQAVSWYNPFVTSGIRDDGSAGKFPIGFSFPFYDVNYDSFYVGANGAISFTNNNVNVNGYFEVLSIPGIPFTTFLSAFWNDLNIDPTLSGHGDVYIYRSPTKDTLIIEYYRVGNFNLATDTMTTFEMILTHNGNITFQYLSVGSSGLQNTATVGISAFDCASEPFANKGAPAQNVVSDGSTVFFDYSRVITRQSGDPNNDNAINVGDVVYLINHVFKGGPPSVDPPEGNANCDGSTNVADAVYLINHIFKSATAPCFYVL